MECEKSQLDSVSHGVEEIRTLAEELLPQTERLIGRLQRFRLVLKSVLEQSSRKSRGKGDCDAECEGREGHLSGLYESGVDDAMATGVQLEGVAVGWGNRENRGSHEWLSIADAARMAEVHRGTIARQADAGKLIENGEKKHKRRVLKESVLQWMGERVENQRLREFAKYERDIERIPERH